jgi:2,5-diamino-6-(ribosylamino)-4(3H)-pyrimidinone 5'-phosphate reductase
LTAAETAKGLPEPAATYLALTFPDPPQDRPYVILNMISSADGKAVAGDTEALLSSPTDKLALQSLRARADCILNGAGTVRVSGVNPVIRDPRLRAWRAAQGRAEPPLQGVLAGSANLPADSAFLHNHSFHAVVFVSETADEARVAALRGTGRPVESLPAGERLLPELLLRLFRDYQVRLLLLEGGPGLNWGFFRSGLIDEFFLTLSPRIAGGQPSITVVEGDLIPKAAMPELELLSAFPNPETSEVFLHWRVRRG